MKSNKSSQLKTMELENDYSFYNKIIRLLLYIQKYPRNWPKERVWRLCSNDLNWQKHTFKTECRLFEAEEAVYIYIQIWTHRNFFMDRTRLFWQKCTGKLNIFRVQPLVWHHPDSVWLSKWVTESMREIQRQQNKVQLEGKNHFLLFWSWSEKCAWVKWEWISTL